MEEHIGVHCRTFFKIYHHMDFMCAQNFPMCAAGLHVVNKFV